MTDSFKQTELFRLERSVCPPLKPTCLQQHVSVHTNHYTENIYITAHPTEYESIMVSCFIKLELLSCVCMLHQPVKLQFIHICSVSYSNLFTHESKWAFVPNVVKVPPGFSEISHWWEWNGHEVTVCLTTGHQNVISPFLSPSGCLCPVLSNCHSFQFGSLFSSISPVLPSSQVCQLHSPATLSVSYPDWTTFQHYISNLFSCELNFFLDRSLPLTQFQ